MKATIRKAIPAQNKLPLSNQTTRAITAAGKKKSITLTIATIMMMPMTNKTSSAMTSTSNGKPKNAKR